jgi:hypothetical protein
MTSEEVLLKTFKILPRNRKQELLDFAEFLTRKESESHGQIRHDLNVFEQGEIQHLELEFENYDELYPRR